MPHARAAPGAGWAREPLTGLASLSGTEVAVPGHYASSGPPLWNSVIGVVRSDVTSIDVKMTGGRTVSVRSVAAAGHRWIGLVFRDGVLIARATAYAGTTEPAYSAPFVGGDLRAGTYFLSWLHPGQPGPAQGSRYIASGGPGGRSWGALIMGGQFGYCVGSVRCRGPPALRRTRSSGFEPAVLTGRGGQTSAR